MPTRDPAQLSNEILDRLPSHLRQFIKPQNYEAYTPINQAVWRYVMRKNISYLPKVAHESYLRGLEQTGISVDRIPSMYGMNRILKDIGWAAVAVDGFIPPNAFMEFQAYKVLVIASDIRQLENIEYTPAPDIIHEAAGHAPIIANPMYAEYLRRFGEIGAKAILSNYDVRMYEAIRKLSILKEAAGTDPAEIALAEREVERLQAEEPEFSEMAQIRNLHWWTVEYGLIGSLENPRIYGAGLLSSIGESQSCRKEEVRKLPFSLAAADQGFDITQPQPQLYVTPSFAHLMEVLEAFADTMSVRRGGSEGLRRLIASGMVGTIELNTGLQISGRFERMITDGAGNPIFFKTSGPTALAYRERELVGHGTAYHAHGFSSPLGKLRGIEKPLEDLTPTDLPQYGFHDGKRLSFTFESGLVVDGIHVTAMRSVLGQLTVITLRDCTVTYGEETLFRPEWGLFDMAVGSEIASAFAGAADFRSFPNLYHESETKTIKATSSPELSELENLYAEVRSFREQKDVDEARLRHIFERVTQDFRDDWLLSLEVLELTKSQEHKKEITDHLVDLKQRLPQLTGLIEDGLGLLPLAGRGRR